MKIFNDLPLGTFDLHIHTTASDGRLSPAEIVNRAAAFGLKTIAITDHDTVAGVEEALDAASGLGISVIPGVEITTHWKGQNVDLLGYNLKCLDAFEEKLADFRKYRLERTKKIIAKLCELGMPLSLTDVQKICKGEVITRPHIALALVVKGFAFSSKEAFVHYLGDGKPADVRKKEISLTDGIQMIRDAGGVAVLAHPALLRNPALVEEITVCGIDGIEVWHRKHNKKDVRDLIDLAEKHDLLMTGGSDFHTDEHTLGRFL
jgi:predicted metal-dependent phosphoesterase TrpH